MQIVSRTRSQLVVEQAEDEPELALKGPPAPARWMTRRKSLIGFAALLPLLALAWAVVARRHPLALAENSSVLVADIANSTGDPVFDNTLRQGLIVQLEQSPYLDILSRDRIQQTLELMGRSRSQLLTPDVARDVCERVGASLLLLGSITSLGSQYVLRLRVEDCRGGRVLDAEQEQVLHKEDVLGALSRMAERFRRKAGESAATLRNQDVPLEEATTSPECSLGGCNADWHNLRELRSRASRRDPRIQLNAFQNVSPWICRIHGP